MVFCGPHRFAGPWSSSSVAGPRRRVRPAGHFDMALPSFMAHLDLLLGPGAAGLVTSTKTGKRVRTYQARWPPASNPAVGHWARRPAAPGLWGARLDQLNIHPSTSSKGTRHDRHPAGHLLPPCRSLSSTRASSGSCPRRPSWLLAAWNSPERNPCSGSPPSWKTTDAEIDLRPGGICNPGMELSDGDMVNDEACCCVLDDVPGERFVFTGAMGPVSRSNGAEMPFTAFITVAPDGDGCRYTATVLHATPEDAAKHAEMGFHDGPGAALDQLVGIWGH